MKTFFVSSTFKDMNFERDAIKEITLPMLNSYAKKYGQSVSFCDLRWGIDTSDMDEEEGSRKVLRFCLDEIDRCQPPLVIILGERYGWIPPKELVKGIADYKSLIIEDYEKSVTSLEIEYGALSPEKQKCNTLVYIREMEDAPLSYLAEDDEHFKKLDALKERLKQLTNGRIKTYKARWNGKRVEGVDDFATMLAHDLAEIMTQEWEMQASLSPFELDRKIQWDYIEEKAKCFKGRTRLVNSIIGEIENGKRLTFIKGDTGNGKSALFAALAIKFKELGWDTLPFIGGYTLESNDATDILNNTIYYLENALGKEHSANSQGIEENKQTGIEDAQKRLAELCYEYSKSGKRLMIMLDSVERLFPDEARDKLRFIPENLGDNIRFFLTANTCFLTTGVEYTTLAPLEKSEVEDVTREILRQVNRELDKNVIEDIKNLPSSQCPLYLSLLIQRLLMMNSDDFFEISSSGDGMSAISRHQREIIKACPLETDRLSSALISEAGKRINPSLIKSITEYIAFSRFGLRESDLEGLVGKSWRAIDFAHFLSYMRESFIMRDDGRFDFAHQSIREGIKKDCTDQSLVYEKLFEHFSGLDTDDSIRQSELLFHAIKANKQSFVVEHITDGYDTEQTIVDMKTVYDITRTDGTDWFKDTIANIKDKNRLIKFNFFVGLCVFSKFVTKQEDISLGTEILQANNEAVKSLALDGSDESKRACLFSDIYLSLCLILHSFAHNKDRIELSVTSGLEEARLMYAKTESSENRELLASFLYIASLYNGHLGIRTRSIMAIELFKEFADMVADFNGDNKLFPTQRVSIYNHLSILYSQLGDKESINSALEYAEKASQLAREENASDTDLIAINSTLGSIYLTIGGKNNIQKALDIYKGIYQEMKIIASRTGEITARENLLHARNNYIKALMDSGLEGALSTALPEAIENVQASDLIASELGTVASLRNSILFNMNAIAVLSAIGGADNVRKASKLLDKANEIAEEIAKRTSASGNTLELVSQKLRFSATYASTNVIDNQERCAKLLMEAIDILEKVKEETPDAQAIDLLECDVYNSASMTFVNKALVDISSSKKSIEMAILSAQRSVEAGLRLKEKNENDWERMLSVAYNNSAFVYRTIYVSNVQIINNFLENVGSPEMLCHLWEYAGSNTPYENIWLPGLTEKDFESIGDFSSNLSLDDILSDDTDRLERAIEEEQELEETAEKIQNASRLRALEFYKRSIGIMEVQANKLESAQWYELIANAYQNIAEMYAFDPNADNLDYALEYQSKAIEFTRLQYEKNSSDMTRFYLIRSLSSLAGIYFLQEDTKNQLELSYDILKDGIELYDSWQLAELLTILEAICKNATEVLANDYAALDTEKAEYIFNEYLSMLADRDENGSDITLDYPTTLCQYARFIKNSGVQPIGSALDLVTEAYAIMKEIDEENQDATVLKTTIDAISTIKELYEAMEMDGSYEYCAILKDFIEYSELLDDFISENDIYETDEEYKERNISLLETRRELSLSEHISNEECIDTLIQGYMRAKIVLTSLDEETSYAADDFIEFVNDYLLSIPGGKEELESIDSLIEESSIDDEDDADDYSDTSDGYSSESLAIGDDEGDYDEEGADPSDILSLLGDIDPSMLSDPEFLQALLNSDDFPNLLSALQDSLPEEDDDGEDEDDDSQ